MFCPHFPLFACMPTVYTTYTYWKCISYWMSVKLHHNFQLDQSIHWIYTWYTKNIWQDNTHSSGTVYSLFTHNLTSTVQVYTYTSQLYSPDTGYALLLLVGYTLLLLLGNCLPPGIHPLFFWYTLHLRYNTNTLAICLVDIGIHWHLLISPLL